MSTVDVVFYGLCAVYAGALAFVFYRWRRQPLYDPRILFTLAASLWLLIIHGYALGFEGYLAAKPGFYTRDIEVLSAFAIGAMLIGYVSFIAGASLGTHIRIPRQLRRVRNDRMLSLICVLCVVVALLNFSANVVLISGGDIVEYITTFALRPYDVEDNKGVSAVGYLFGFVGVQVLAYVVGREKRPTAVIAALFVAVAIVLVMRLSQGRIFQTLVLLGGCYVSYALGAAKRDSSEAPWLTHVPLLFAIAAAGVGIYFLRLASSLARLGVNVDWHSVSSFGVNFLHFALERGNVPNYPIVFTILDKVPSEVDFLYGKTLFNWAIYVVPKSILPSDYLISLWVKNTWYLSVEGGGLPPTAVGEWYANFGPAGIVAGMFLVGLLLGLCYKFAVVADSPFPAVLWANLAFGFIVIYPKTDLAQIPAFSIIILTLIAVVLRIIEAAGRRLE